MFTYKKALIKEKVSRPVWIERDVLNENMVDLFNDYFEVVLVLTNPFYPNEVGVHLKEIPDYLDPRLPNRTVSQFLTDLGNDGLPILDAVPSNNFIWAEYKDGFMAGYNIDLVDPDTHFTVGVPRAVQVDLRLTKEGVVPLDFYKNCLVTVNGLLHRLNYVGDSIHVIGGGKSNYLTNKNHIGVFNLGMLGELTTVPISKFDISSGNEHQPMYEATYVAVHESAGDLTNKTVLLSIGGYLHIPSRGDVTRAGERLYQIRFKDMPFARRFYEMRDRTDVSEWTDHLDVSTNNDAQVSVAQLYSDETLTKLLLSSKSFFIIVDTPDVVFEKVYLEDNHLPGSFIHHEEPLYPLISSDGAMAEYWFHKENDRYVIKTADLYRPNYLFETTNWKEMISIDNKRVPSNPVSFGGGYFLKIGTQEKA